MVLLESLTGGIIDKESILKEYKKVRERGERNRYDALVTALEHLMFERFHTSMGYELERQLNTPEYRIGNKKVASNEFGDVYRVAVLSYPNARPVEFIVEVYKVVPKLDEQYYKYILYLVDSSGNKKVLDDSEEDFEDAGHIGEISGTFESLSDTMGFVLEYVISYKMVDYAVEKSGHSISEGLFWGDKVW